MAKQDWKQGTSRLFYKQIKKGQLSILTDADEWGGPCVLELSKIHEFRGGYTFDILMARRFETCSDAEKYANEHFPEFRKER